MNAYKIARVVELCELDAIQIYRVNRYSGRALYLRGYLSLMGNVMRAIKTFTLIAAAILAAGCAAQRNPIIDMRGVDEKQFDQDWEECEAYTEEVPVATGVAKGAGLGAVIGAAAAKATGTSMVTRRCL